LKLARDTNQLPPLSITQLQTRLDALVEDVAHAAKGLLAPGHRAALQGLAHYAINKWTDIAGAIESR
jgi:hypothetical protein